MTTDTRKFWSKVWSRILLRRLKDPTWQACFSPPFLEVDNRCFNIDWVERCTKDETKAYDLLITDFLHLNHEWQLNLTGRTYSQWCSYERIERTISRVTMTHGEIAERVADAEYDDGGKP